MPAVDAGGVGRQVGGSGWGATTRAARAVHGFGALVEVVGSPADAGRGGSVGAVAPRRIGGYVVGPAVELCLRGAETSHQIRAALIGWYRSHQLPINANLYVHGAAKVVLVQCPTRKLVKVGVVKMAVEIARGTVATHAAIDRHGNTAAAACAAICAASGGVSGGLGGAYRDAVARLVGVPTNRTAATAGRQRAALPAVDAGGVGAQTRRVGWRAAAATKRNEPIARDWPLQRPVGQLPAHGQVIAAAAFFHQRLHVVALACL